MSALQLLQNVTAIGFNGSTSFGATGGTAPYTYEIEGGGAGGSINSSTGVYTAPATPGTDTIVVVDSAGSSAFARIMVGTAFDLVCDIIQSQLGLQASQVYLWDQKIDIPTDGLLYVAVGVQAVKQFGSRFSVDGSGSGLLGRTSGNFQATLSIDILSRSSLARDQKELVPLALASAYSQSQQDANSFYIATLPTGFVDNSGIDGAAIPYRFTISVNIQYAVSVAPAIGYFNTFTNPPSVTTQP